MKNFTRSAAFLRGLSFRRICGFLPVAGLALGPALYAASAPVPIGAAVGVFDSTKSSTNVVFINKILPAINAFVSGLPNGTRVNIGSIGGQNPVLVDGPLTPEAKASVQSQISGAEQSPFSGSDITPIVLRRATEAKQHAGDGRTLVVYDGDAKENRLTKASFTPGQLDGVDALVLFSTSSSSLLSTTLAAAGARVVVAQTQTEVDAAIALAINGETPQRTRMRKLALIAWQSLMLGGLFLLVLPTLCQHRENARRRAQSVAEAKARAEQARLERERAEAEAEEARRARDVKVRPIIFDVQSVLVQVKLTGTSRQVTRTLRVGDARDSILVAGENAGQSDLVVPTVMLDIAPNGAAHITVADARTLTVFNVGQSPLVCEEGRFFAGESAAIALHGGWIMFSPDAQIEFANASEAAPAREMATIASAVNNDLLGDF